MKKRSIFSVVGMLFGMGFSVVDGVVSYTDTASLEEPLSRMIANILSSEIFIKHFLIYSLIGLGVGFVFGLFMEKIFK
ncbi:MAG: hypothetical protein ACFN00_00575 [Flavobacteriaceae bacterium]